MTDITPEAVDLLPCPWGCKAKHGLTKGHRDMHGDLNQRYAVWCGHARIVASDKDRAFGMWNARAAIAAMQPAPTDEQVERVAKAMNGPYDATHIGEAKLRELQDHRWEHQTYKTEKNNLRLMAFSAIAAMQPTPAEMEYDDIPDTPEQRAFIKAHNDEIRRKYPNLKPTVEITPADAAWASGDLVPATAVEAAVLAEREAIFELVEQVALSSDHAAERRVLSEVGHAIRARGVTT